MSMPLARPLIAGILTAAMGLLAGPADGATVSAAIDPDLFGTLDQADTNCPDDNCGPTAAVNSFVYLQTRFPRKYGTNLVPDTNGNNQIDYAEMVAVANDLGANFMQNCPICGPGGGTFIEDFIFGKNAYIESMVPGVTRYRAQMNFAWREDVGNHQVEKPSFVQDETKPTLAFLARELAHGEDVEVFVGTNGHAHYLTLTGIEYDDTTNTGKVSYVDPLGGVRGTANILGLSDGFIELDYQLGGTNTFVFHAVSESVPEPAAVVLLVAALAVMAVAGRRRAPGR